MGRQQQRGRGGKNNGRNSTRLSTSFIDPNNDMFSSQGLREVNRKVDELLSFPSQEPPNYPMNYAGALYRGFTDDRNIRDSDSGSSTLDKILHHVESLNSKFDNFTREFSYVKGQLKIAQDEIKELKNQNRQINQELKAIKESKLENAQNSNLHNLQREVRQKSLLLSGPNLKIPNPPVPRKIAENAILAFEKETGSKIALDHIQDCRRFGKTEDDSRILVTFTSTFVKDELLTKYITRQRPDEDTPPKLFVNEYLSNEQSNIFYRVRQLKRQENMRGLIHSVFTRKGITACKLTANSTPKYFNSINDVTKLREELLNVRSLRSGRNRQ